MFLCVFSVCVFTYLSDVVNKQNNIIISHLFSIQEVGVDTSKKASAFDLVRTPNMRKKSLNIFFNW